MRRRVFTWAMVILATGSLLGALLVPGIGLTACFVFLLPPAPFELSAPQLLVQFVTAPEPIQVSCAAPRVESSRAPPA